MFKENRQIHQQPESTGKTNLGRGFKGIIKNNPEDTAEGFLGGEPSPIEGFRRESRELQGTDPEGIISKIKNKALKAIKVPTSLARSALETGHGATKWGTLQVNKGIQQVRNLVATVLALPVKGWEVVSYYPKAVIKKITDTTHAAIDKIIGFIPTNHPREAPSPA
jgi:hypothetical protein